MPWPLASDFSTMVQQPRLAFRDPRLQACRIERNFLNQPRVWAGQFAVVYKGVDPQGTAWAVGAFIRKSSDGREHYGGCEKQRDRQRKKRANHVESPLKKGDVVWFVADQDSRSGEIVLKLPGLGDGNLHASERPVLGHPG